MQKDDKKVEKKSSDLLQSLVINMIARRLNFDDKDAFMKTIKDKGTTVISDLITDVATNSRLKNWRNIERQDVMDLLKRHGLQQVIKTGQSIIVDKMSDKSKETPTEENQNTTNSNVNNGNNAGNNNNGGNFNNQNGNPNNNQNMAQTSGVTLSERTNFGEFVNYVVNNPAYKDGFSDAGIVSFIASQSGNQDIVLGFAPRWEKVILQSRLLSSSLDKKSAQRLTAQFIENLFDKDMSDMYKEHFNLVKPAAQPAARTPAAKAPRKTTKR